MYSVFAKATVCLMGPEVSSYYIRVHTFDDLFHFVSFRFVLFRFVPFRVLSLAQKLLEDYCKRRLVIKPGTERNEMERNETKRNGKERQKGGLWCSEIG